MTKSHNITPQQARDWLAAGEAILIDVREPDEFKAEHIAYASSLPLGQVAELFNKMQVPAKKKIIFQCFRGKRGEQACAIAPQSPEGREFYNIEGGIEAWKEAGLPTVTTGSAKMSIFRQVQIIIGSLVAILTLIGFLGHTWGFILAGLLGVAFAVAGITGWCGMALLLAKMPWNKR